MGGGETQQQVFFKSKENMLADLGWREIPFPLTIPPMDDLLKDGSLIEDSEEVLSYVDSEEQVSSGDEGNNKLSGSDVFRTDSHNSVETIEDQLEKDDGTDFEVFAALALSRFRLMLLAENNAPTMPTPPARVTTAGGTPLINASVPATTPLINASVVFDAVAIRVVPILDSQQQHHPQQGVVSGGGTVLQLLYDVPTTMTKTTTTPTETVTPSTIAKEGEA